MTDIMTKEALIAELADYADIQDLGKILDSVNRWDGSLGEFDYQHNDSDFFETYYYHNVEEAVRAVCYGNYNFTDEYVRINDYGNLDSFSDYDVESDIYGSAKQIIERFLELCESEPKYFNYHEIFNADMCELMHEYEERVEKYV